MTGPDLFTPDSDTAKATAIVEDWLRTHPYLPKRLKDALQALVPGLRGK